MQEQRILLLVLHPQLLFVFPCCMRTLYAEVHFFSCHIIPKSGTILS
nr:MAG TPA_asm: hypothetical protein [Caudoviricetes sp.]